MAGAVTPFKRLVRRNTPEGEEAPDPTALIFPKRHRELFNRILDEENLKVDREGSRHTAYSLRQ